MIVKERVLTSRLIQKMNNNNRYAKRIGLNYTILGKNQKRNNL